MIKDISAYFFFGPLINNYAFSIYCFMLHSIMTYTFIV